MDTILFDVFLKSIDLIPQQQILQRHYLQIDNVIVLSDLVDILQKHLKKDHVHMRLWTRFYGCVHIMNMCTQEHQK